MPPDSTHQQQLETAIATLRLPPGIQVRCWSRADAPAIEHLSTRESWSTPARRPEATLAAWQNSWPTLVVTEQERVVGFVRGITDGAITLFIAELLVDPVYRGRGLGRLLLDTCHALFPQTRLDLISTADAAAFYKAGGFRSVGEGLRRSYR
jgi:predicted N-acetyltransferase YhbS